MKSIICSLLLLVGASSLLASEDSYGPPSVPKRERPILELENTRHNFGKVLMGMILTHEFRFRNVGKAPLEISRVKPSCGCTTVDYDRIVEPGEEGRIELKLDTDRGRPGRTSKAVTIYCNDPSNRTMRIYLDCNLEAVALFAPTAARLGGLYTEDKNTVVTVKQGSDLEFTIESVDTLLEDVRASVVEVEKGRQYELHVESSASLKPQLVRDKLRLTLRTTGGEFTTMSLPIHVDHQDPIAVSPRRNLLFPEKEIRLLQAGTKKKIVRNVNLNANGGETRFTIREVRLEGVPEELFETRLVTLEEGRRYQVEVVLTKVPAGTAILRGKVVIVTDDELQPERSLAIIASARRAGIKPQGGRANVGTSRRP